ncbi:DinB family protein [Pontibacter anaerobius]|uniref:DinB family protein n=1 Tax=Pontibacter anaerobius TaxID=2993940 RepID=A0ABT3RJH3_9BACT|nr:DinB family protein [Pontibacter anaerobius]MCX2741523.1 DinB family protein [Pontibacter anaerobius]
MKHEKQLREQLVKLMQGGQAFRSREELLEGLTAAEAGQQVTGMPYTIWQLLDHLRFAQHDILDFCRNPDYKEPTWPDDYWPSTKTAPPDEAALQQTLQAMANDLQEMIQLVQDPEKDLFEPFAHGQGQTLLREALLVAEHNAYHLGQIVLLRKLLGQFQ